MKSTSTENRQRLARFLTGDKNALNGYRIHRQLLEEPPGYPNHDPREGHQIREVEIEMIEFLRRLEQAPKEDCDRMMAERRSTQFRDYVAKHESWLLENGYLGWMKQKGYKPQNL